MRGSEAGTLSQQLSEMFDLAIKPVATPPELWANLQGIYRLLFLVDFQSLDVGAVRSSARQAMLSMFEMRMYLRDQIGDWQARGLMTHDVQAALRDVFRVSRYASDMLGELLIGHNRLPDGARTLRGFSGSDANVFVHSRFQTGQDLPFQSGDVVLVRGMAHNSAAIARIGDVDSQFSHVGMIYVDPNGRPWMVESLIEEGATINTLEKSLEHNLGRAIVFRHQDAELAARAARLIHAHVNKSRTGRAPHIYYDFTMRLDDSYRLFCSKLIRLAFKKASEGKQALPAFPTKLDMKNRDFLDRVGVETLETFAPGDLEIDPRFHVVAEWQDYRVTASLRNQDMIMTKLFEWMETHNYRFQEDFTIRLIGFLGRLSSHLSESAKDMIADVVPKVPDNMRRKTIAVIAMLHKTAQPILEKLQEIERDTIQRTGHPPHPREVLAYLEDVRKSSNGRIGYLAGTT